MKNMKNEKIEIYSSKKKNFLGLIGSLLFVVGGIFMFLYANSFNDELGTKIIGLASISFFGLVAFVTLRRLIKNQLMLVIDDTGINVNPKKSEIIEWKNITGFSEIKKNSTKIIIIDVNNPDYWIEKEKNAIRKTAMKYSFRECRSPFSLSANVTQLSHVELMKLLNENLQKYSSVPSFVERSV